MRKVDALSAVAEVTDAEDLFVTSVGSMFDDWWNLRPGGVDNTFSLGILGSVTSTAFGLALALPRRRVVALETDGSVLMNTGVMCTLGAVRPPNLTVIVIDNEVYESIGSPPTHTAWNTDLAKMAEGAGCINCETVRDPEALSSVLHGFLGDEELGYLVAKVEAGRHRWPEDQRKPTGGIEDKFLFMRYVERLEGIQVHRPRPDLGDGRPRQLHGASQEK